MIIIFKKWPLFFFNRIREIMYRGYTNAPPQKWGGKRILTRGVFLFLYFLDSFWVFFYLEVCVVAAGNEIIRQRAWHVWKISHTREVSFFFFKTEKKKVKTKGRVLFIRTQLTRIKWTTPCAYMWCEGVWAFLAWPSMLFVKRRERRPQKQTLMQTQMRSFHRSLAHDVAFKVSLGECLRCRTGRDALI